MIKKIFYMSLIIFLCTAFKKDNTANTVYVVGYKENSKGINVAIIWKDGVPTNLSNGKKSTIAKNIVISGEDIYVTGEENLNNGKTKTIVWKNGVATYLSYGTQSITPKAIAVSGTDVYVAAYIENNASNYFTGILFKNAKPYLIVGKPKQEGTIDDVAISGTDVYCTGSLTNNGTIAKLYKNGKEVPLGTINHIVDKVSLAVNSNDVYVGYNVENIKAGNYCTPFILKNGVKTALTNGKTYARIVSLFVKDNNVYALGNEQNEAGNDVIKLWKNGVATTYATSGENENTKANGMYVNGTDVYVSAAGEVTPNNIAVAKIFKNGVAITLTDTSTYGGAYSVFVK
jgi:hypothetical protein